MVFRWHFHRKSHRVQHNGVTYACVDKQRSSTMLFQYDKNIFCKPINCWIHIYIYISVCVCVIFCAQLFDALKVSRKCNTELYKIRILSLLMFLVIFVVDSDWTSSQIIVIRCDFFHIYSIWTSSVMWLGNSFGIGSCRININTLRPRQNDSHFAVDILKFIHFCEKCSIWIQISLKFAPKGTNQQ